jgi:hypothetical protein
VREPLENRGRVQRILSPIRQTPPQWTQPTWSCCSLLTRTTLPLLPWVGLFDSSRPSTAEQRAYMDHTLHVPKTQPTIPLLKIGRRRIHRSLVIDTYVYERQTSSCVSASLLYVFKLATFDGVFAPRHGEDALEIGN